MYSRAHWHSLAACQQTKYVSLLSISKVPITIILTTTNSLLLLFLNTWEIISAVSLHVLLPKKKRGGVLWLQCSHSLCQYKMVWYKNSIEVALYRQHLKQRISQIKKKKVVRSAFNIKWRDRVSQFDACRISSYFSVTGIKWYFRSHRHCTIFNLFPCDN